MTNAAITNHGNCRMKSRSISIAVVDLIREYGHTIRRRNADVYLLNRDERNWLMSDLDCDERKKVERKLRAYAVISNDGALITCGYRRKRFYSAPVRGCDAHNEKGYRSSGRSSLWR